MAEAMGVEQLAEIRAAADRDRWSTYCGHAGPRAMVTDLLAEIDRLRVQAAEIGETLEEWGTRWEGHERVESFGYGPDAELLARENTHPRDELMTRLVSVWREVSE